MNVPDDRVPLLKSITVDYQRRIQGNLKAEANLTVEQIKLIKQYEKGDITVPVITRMIQCNNQSSMKCNGLG